MPKFAVKKVFSGCARKIHCCQTERKNPTRLPAVRQNHLNRHPVFVILPGAAEGDEGLQEVGEAFFPGAFAGDLGGELGFALRGGVEQAD